MKRILIPVDFSKGSLNSCKYAIEIATKSEPVALWHFHVSSDQMMYMMPGTDPDGLLTTTPMMDMEFVKEMEKTTTKNMNKLHNDLIEYINQQGYTNFTINKRIFSGDPQWLIEDICEELDIDGIIMSTSGAGNKTPLEGSMALKIIGKAKVPVIAVPVHYKNYSFKNILYATKLDDDKTDIWAINRLFELFKHQNFKMYVVHFRKSYKHQVTPEALENAFEKQRLDEKIRFMIVNNDNNNETTIKTVAAQNEIDLIAFIAHKTHPLKILFSRGIHKNDFLATELPVVGLHYKQ